MNIFKFLFSKIDESTNDKLGAYPERVHVNAMPERRYLKTSRVMAFVASGLMCGAVIWGCLIYMLAPMIRSDPALLTINKRFYRLDPVEDYMVWGNPSMLLMEQYIKEYIVQRHTIIPDIDEMKARWGARSFLRWASSTDVFAGFLAEKKVNDARMLDGVTAEVKVRTVERVTNGLWLAEFDIIEHIPENELPTVLRYRALMSTGFGGEARPYPNRDERIKNPLNFTVKAYDLSSRPVTADNIDAKFYD